ncbi:hypothetical protein L2E82_43982 [Cichorium intybus]|uniref:Uncharacterized protein n=1 Tax=Cichorium intybus TaxID=13427 RepID=A0ACB8ZPP7_CICIN|nr:hypothetical protein L2E82_43982 [Cichorium intybus]
MASPLLLRTMLFYKYNGVDEDLSNYGRRSPQQLNTRSYGALSENRVPYPQQLNTRSYGELSENRVPYSPRSGRSYYTHYCWRGRGPVRSYTRDCSTITRCSRSGALDPQLEIHLFL